MSAKPSSLLQRSISLIELIMFIVVTGVVETGMCIDPEPNNLSGILQ